MPLNIKALQGKENTLEDFEFAGEKVEVTYRSGIITAGWEAKWKDKPDGLYHQASELIVSWDVMKDAKTKYPTTVAALKELPFEFVAAVVAACAADLVPNRRTSRRSGDSSFGA